MKYILNKIEKWLKNTIKEAVESLNLEKLVKLQVEESIEKLRFDYLPHGACWLCSMPVSRKGGYTMWQGKMFCNKTCFDKYSQIVQKPDDKHFMFNGDPIEIFNPK